MISLPKKSKTARRLLYVDEHKESREMLAFVLGKAGYDVTTAATAADGLRVATREQFDLVILEYGYRNGDGVELCQQLRVSHPHMPIIFFSSYAYGRDIEIGMAAGAQRYLVKPLGIYDIERTLVELLANPVETPAYAGNALHY